MYYILKTLIMKRILFLLLVTLFFGCRNDDDGSSFIGLQGKWNLINVSGGFIGADNDFDKGVIIWEFNEVSKQLVITNNNVEPSISDGLAAGTYSYTILPLNDVMELVVNEINLGVLQIQDRSFTLNELPRDGFIFSFER